MIRRCERMQVSDSARCADLEACIARHQGAPTQRGEIYEAAQRGLLFREQPRPSRQPGVAVTPVRTRSIRRPPNHVGNGVEIHGRTPGRRVVVLAIDPQWIEIKISHSGVAR